MSSACFPRSGSVWSAFSAVPITRSGTHQLGLHPAASGEPPLGHEDRLTLVVVDRVAGEEGADVVDQHAVLEWVDPARGDLRDERRLVGSGGGDGDDRCHHHVDRDHVDGAFRHPWELTQQAAGVGDDHRLGHAEAADPTRVWFRPGRLDDRRAHDRDRHVALGLEQGLFAERLGEGVGVGPPDARRSRPPGLDQLVLDPPRTELLGLGRQRRRAGGAELGTRFLAELGELVGLAAGRLGVALEAAGGGDLGAPVESDRERTLAHELLGRRAAPVAGDVAGRHCDQVRSDRQGLAELGDAGGAEQIDLDRRRQRRIERHRGGGVDHDVGGGEGRPIGVAQAEPIGADVAGDGRDPPLGHRLEGLAAIGTVVRRPQAIEGVVLEQFLLRPCRRRRALAVANEQDQLAVGNAAQQPFDESGADETGPPGDGDALACERFSDHNATCLPDGREQIHNVP